MNHTCAGCLLCDVVVWQRRQWLERFWRQLDRLPPQQLLKLCRALLKPPKEG